MRFLQSFLEEANRQDTTPKELPKPTEPQCAAVNTTPEALTEPTKPSSVSFVSGGTLVITGNLSEAVKDVFFINKPCQLELFVKQVSPCPIGPVTVASGSTIFGAPDDMEVPQVSGPPVPYVTILDPAKFVSATLADLARYVAAKNQGRHHSWIENILDEKIEQLRLCGVEAEIRVVQ